ncbi:MAG: methylmalonyl-CoA epimerase [Candidatus Krumholzibacteriia bacterium]
MHHRLGAVNHIGIAVKNLEEAKKVFSDALGLSCIDEKALPERGVKVAFLSTGNTTIELLEGIGPESTVSKFVEQRGPGIHHLCFEVEGIERVMKELAESGVRLIDETPRPGAEGKLVAFVHPKSTLGVLVELIEK